MASLLSRSQSRSVLSSEADAAPWPSAVTTTARMQFVWPSSVWVVWPLSRSQLKEAGAWPLASLKAAFFQGQFTRLEKADEALRQTISRAVQQGTLGLASGKDAAKFDRVWFKENVDVADITFDFDTYVLLPGKAKALKEAPSRPFNAVVAPEPTATTQPEISGVTGSAFSVTPEFPVSSLETKVVNWEGELRRDQWNLFSLKVLTRLAQAKSVKINVKVDAEIEDAQTLDQLNTGLRELGLTNLFSQT
jgi:hypothetical protein